jgi:hypothetical protein
MRFRRRAGSPVGDHVGRDWRANQGRRHIARTAHYEGALAHDWRRRDDGRPHDVPGRHDDRVWLDNRAVLLDAKQPMSAFGSSELPIF